MRVPKVDSLDEFTLPLAKMVAKTSFLPHPNTVKSFSGAIFPTIRKRQNRAQEIKNGEEIIGMYDDNTTPQWALFWAHNIVGTRPKGWTIAHVWPNKNDIDSYTHLANLIMIPECFAALTDKAGPMTEFLRWHSRSVYGWMPKDAPKPKKPDGFDMIKWRYFENVKNPRELIQQRLQTSDNQRVRVLRPIMERCGELSSKPRP